MYKVVNVEGSEEVVEITYDRKGNRKGKDDLADEMGTESFAVWYRSIGLLTLKEANHTLNTADFDANEERHAGDTSPNEGVDTDASTETSVVPHVHKKFILGNHIDTEIGMARPSTNGRRGTDHVEEKSITESRISYKETVLRNWKDTQDRHLRQAQRPQEHHHRPPGVI